MLQFEVDTRRLEKAFDLAPDLLKEELKDAFDHISKKFLKNWRKKRLQGPPGVFGDGRTGLFGTFNRTFTFGASLLDMGVEISSKSKVAQIHQTGGVETANSGGDLAVPLSDRPGRKMHTAKGRLLKRYKDPKNIKNTRVVNLKGKKYLVKQKRGGEIVPLYRLKRSVVLKPRLFFYETFEELQNDRIRIINKAIDKAIARI